MSGKLNGLAGRHDFADASGQTFGESVRVLFNDRKCIVMNGNDLFRSQPFSREFCIFRPMVKLSPIGRNARSM